MCSASSPVITSTLSNRTFSTVLEIQADVDSISVVFLNKAVSVGEKKKKKEILSVKGIFIAHITAHDFRIPCVCYH